MVRASGSTVAPRRRLSVDDRREELLRIGIGMASHTSFDEMSIDDIAAKAGVSKSLLYHYFGGKRDYYVACVRLAAEELQQASLPAEGLSPGARLLAGLDGYLRYVEEHAVGFLALLRGTSGADAEVAALAEDFRDGMVTRVLEDLAVDPSVTLLRVAARGWVGFVEHATLEWVTQHRTTTGSSREVVKWLCARTLLDVVGAVVQAVPSLPAPELDASLLALLEPPGAS